MTPSLQEIQRRLSEARDDLFLRYPIRSLGIFGSFARNEARIDSDIDT